MNITFTVDAELESVVIDSALEFVADITNAVAGASVTVDLIADGNNAPTFSGFREWGGSAGYRNAFDVRNCVTFFYRAGIAWYSVMQPADQAAEGLQVLPPAPPPPPPPPPPAEGVLRVLSLVNAVESGNAVDGWNYTSAATGFVNGGTLDQHLGAEVDGHVQFEVAHSCVPPHNSVMGFQASPTWGYAVASIAFGIWIHQSGTIYTAHNGSYVSTGVSCQLGDIIRGKRVGATITWERMRDNEWVPIKVYSGAATGLLYCWLNLSDTGSTAFNLRGMGLL